MGQFEAARAEVAEVMRLDPNYIDWRGCETDRGVQERQGRQTLL
jgi:hypothetical protein